MTVGIAVSGPGAVPAALAALGAIEAVGRGAIGGFVSLVAIADGALLTAGVQRGGTGALRPDTLGAPFAEARLAALMSSGPDRPEPLVQFTPGDAAVGLMTGHRLPNMPGPGGTPPNLVALGAMRSGAGVVEAIEMALAEAPEADAGLIAMDLSGRIALANSALVARRDDIGAALVEDPGAGLSIGVLHNSIFPARGLAEVAVAAALDLAAPADAIDGEARLVGESVTLGDMRALDLASDGSVAAITVDDPTWLGPAWEGSVVLRGDPVLRYGRPVGRITREVYCRLENGRIIGARGGEMAAWRKDLE
ncbi:DUF6963 family protein [Mesobacterium pallidum]|uniref:DUF6963 family protein n=1 Tax=Mesobacterium pallidum TaxID=2872037 RepID=UPI001EE28D8D|nr:hypothetical protein [Mesobacterium pallidum]